MKKATLDEIQIYYSQSLERCLNAFSQLDETEWAKKASDHWTAKEHLAHLASALEDQSLPLTRQSLAGEPGRLPGFDKRSDEREFNQRAIAKLRDLPASEILDRIKGAVAKHIQILDSLSEADLDKPASDPGWDRSGTLRDLYFAAYLLFPNQYQAIRRANKKKLPHWISSGTTEQAHYHVDRLFHFMPLIYRSEENGDFAAVYQFTMEGAAGGQWAIRIADGKADSSDGPAESFDAEVRTKPELWMDLASGDLSPPIAIMTRKVKLGGNAGLAMKLSSLFGNTG